MWLLIVPILILCVLVFSVFALTAGVVALVGAGWPWLLIALGIWMFWHEDGRHFRRQRGWHGKTRGQWPAPQPVAAGGRQQAPSRKPSEKPSDRLSQPLHQSELPIDVQVKVEQIRRKVDVLLSYADRFPPFSKDLYLVRQTADDYLPRTINAYLAMPKETAEKPLAADGKTAHQELKAQLDLLDSRLDDIAQDLERQDTDRLLANRRFLEQRFGLRGRGPDVGVA